MDRRFLRDLLITVIAIGAGIWIFGVRPQSAPLEQRPSQERSESAPLFLRRAADRDFLTLTRNDLPSVASGYKNGVVWKDHVFALTDISSIAQRRTILEYDQDGKLVGQFNHRLGVCDQPRDLAIIRDMLYLACVGRGAVAIDLARDAVARTYGAADGLQNLLNLEFAVDGTTLWVGTFNGVGKIDTETGEVRFYQEELGIPGGQFPAKYGTHVQARNGEVWAVVNANAHSVGGAARYDAATDQWTPYGPEAFGVIRIPQREYRIDLFPVILTDDGAYALHHHRGGRRVLSRFDGTQGVWLEAAREGVGEAARREFDAQLPSPEMYRSFESQRAENGAAATFRIVRDGAWAPGKAVGREYLAMTEPVDGVRFLLSTIGIEAMSAADFEPHSIARAAWIPGGSTGLDALTVSEDGQYLVAVSRTMNDFSGGVWSYDAGVLVRSTGLFTHAHMESSDGAPLPDPPRKGSQDAVALEQAPDGLTILINGEPLFRFDRAANRIRLLSDVQ